MRSGWRTPKLSWPVRPAAAEAPWSRHSHPIHRPAPEKTKSVNTHNPMPSRFAAAAAVMVLFAPAGCGGRDDETEAPAPPKDPPSSVVTADMLSEGGTTYQPPAQEVPLEELGFDFGSTDAPIGVIEFSDYGCGYCRRFHTRTFPALLRDFVEAGRVRWKYVTYVSGSFANGLPAAFVAECAGEQDLFTPVSRRLYERQTDWSRLDDPFPVFTEIVREAGAELDRLQECINERRPDARVRSGVVSGRRLGLRGTPVFLVDGVPVMGARPLEWWVGFLTAIEAEIEKEPGAGEEPS